MKVFIIGVAGGTGRRIAEQLLARGDKVGGLVRSAEQVESLARSGIHAILGDLVAMSGPELCAAMNDSDVIVFTAGAGGKDGVEATTAIDGKGPGKVAAAANLASVNRLILVSVFPEAWRERHMSEDFERYMVEKKNAEVDLVTRNIDWVIVRPSALQNDPGTGHVGLGLAEIHVEISREDVAATIVALIAEPRIKRVILELTSGTRPINEAVAALLPQC